MTDRARQLYGLLTMIKDIELARLSELSMQVQMAKAASEGLQHAQDQRARHVSELTTPDTALTAGMDEKWRVWSLKETARLHQEIVEICALQEDQRQLARKALGRMQAFEGLQARLSERKGR